MRTDDYDEGYERPFHLRAARFAGPAAFVLALAAIFLGSLVGLFFAFSWLSVPLVVVAVSAIGYATYVYVRYRQGRQDELLQVMAAAVEAKVPLVPALRAYLGERPPRGAIQAVFMGVLQVILPGSILVWVWLWYHRYDLKLEQFIDHLGEGESLAHALHEVPQVLGSEARFAAVLGEETDTLGICLRKAERERLAAAWLEVGPRLLYPAVILFAVTGVVSFLMTMIVPKFKRIFDEFGATLPSSTRTLIDVWYAIQGFVLLVPVAMFGFVVFVGLLIGNTAVRWYAPVFGRFYRWEVQGQILRALGILLSIGKTVPAALEFLIRSPEMPRVVRSRLESARDAVEAGQPLGEALYAAGLLPRGMRPLVLASEKAQSLPWALGELGDHLGQRAFKFVRRASLLVSPFLLLVVGLVVGFVAFAMFVPMIKLMEGLAQ